MYIYTHEDNSVIAIKTNKTNMEGNLDNVKEYFLDITEDMLPTFDTKEYHNTKLYYDGTKFSVEYILDKNKVYASMNNMKLQLAELDYKDQKIIDAIIPQILVLFKNNHLNIDLPYNEEQIKEWTNHRKLIREEYNRIESLINNA